MCNPGDHRISRTCVMYLASHTLHMEDMLSQILCTHPERVHRGVRYVVADMGKALPYLVIPIAQAVGHQIAECKTKPHLSQRRPPVLLFVAHNGTLRDTLIEALIQHIAHRTCSTQGICLLFDSQHSALLFRNGVSL